MMRSRVLLFLFCVSSFCFGLENVKELTLERAFQLALDNHEDIKIYDLEVQRSGLDSKIVASSFLPQISGSAAKNYLDSSVASTSPRETQEAHIKLSQKIIDVSLFTAFRGSRVVLSKAKNDLQNRIQIVLFNVATAYFDLLKNQKLLDVDKSNLSLAKEQYNIVEKRFDFGEVHKADFLHIKSERTHLETVLTTRKASLIVSREVLSNLIGLESIQEFINTGPEVEKEFQFVDINLGKQDGLQILIDFAIENRPDRKAIEDGIEVSNWEIKSLATNNFPTLSANVDKAWVSPRGSKSKNSYWTASIDLEVPLFEGMQNYFKIKEAKNRLSKARLEKKRLTKDIKLQVTKAWLDTKASQANLCSLDQRVDYEKERYDSISSQYESGLSSSLDLMESLRNLSFAKVDLVNKQYEHKTNILSLDKQTGKLGALITK